LSCRGVDTERTGGLTAFILQSQVVGVGLGYVRIVRAYCWEGKELPAALSRTGELITDVWRKAASGTRAAPLAAMARVRRIGMGQTVPREGTATEFAGRVWRRFWKSVSRSRAISSAWVMT
jgi:hypothetical protein